MFAILLAVLAVLAPAASQSISRSADDGSLSMNLASGTSFNVNCPAMAKGNALACDGEGIEVKDGVCQCVEDELKFTYGWILHVSKFGCDHDSSDSCTIEIGDGVTTGSVTAIGKGLYVGIAGMYTCIFDVDGKEVVALATVTAATANPGTQELTCTPQPPSSVVTPKVDTKFAVKLVSVKTAGGVELPFQFPDAPAKMSAELITSSPSLAPTAAPSYAPTTPPTGSPSMTPTKGPTPNPIWETGGMWYKMTQCSHPKCGHDEGIRMTVVPIKGNPNYRYHVLETACKSAGLKTWYDGGGSDTSGQVRDGQGRYNTGGHDLIYEFRQAIRYSCYEYRDSRTCDGHSGGPTLTREEMGHNLAKMGLSDGTYTMVTKAGHTGYDSSNDHTYSYIRYRLRRSADPKQAYIEFDGEDSWGGSSGLNVNLAICACRIRDGNGGKANCPEKGTPGWENAY
jgi:hypothetical protein